MGPPRALRSPMREKPLLLCAVHFPSVSDGCGPSPPRFSRDSCAWEEALDTGALPGLVFQLPSLALSFSGLRPPTCKMEVLPQAV